MKPFARFPSLLFCFAFVLTISSCTVHYVAEYDAGIKQQIIDTAREIDLFWGELLDTDENERPYAKYAARYNEIEADLRSLVVQNEIRPLNKESTTQAKNALELWVEDRRLHKEQDGFSDFEAKRHRTQFERVFIAMAKGEEAKDTGADGQR